MDDGLRYQALQGGAIREELHALASLRLTVFRDWPYLYEGTMAYEQDYLDTYARCPQGVAVLAWEGSRCVGATTAVPMVSAESAMRQPFERAGQRIEDLLYFGESVVLAEHRGRGIGVRFFEQREAHARQLGLLRCAFCAVERPIDHPLRPAEHVGNDTFWQHRGYRRQPDLHCDFDWKDLDQATPTPHRLTFWLRTL